MKQFLKKLSYTVLPLWLLCVGLTAYYHLMVKPYQGGDLGKLGMIPFESFYERPSDPEMPDTLFLQIDSPEQLHTLHADVLVCGDSFTSGRGQGAMGYHSYLARLGFRVVSCSSKGMPLRNPFKTAARMMELGYIDSLNTDVLLIESVERSLIDRLAYYDYYTAEIDEDQWYEPRIESPEDADSSWSLLQARNYASLRLGFERPVRCVKLDAPFFSGTCPADLYFYQDDLLLMSADDEIGRQAMQGLGKLLTVARQKGVRLLLLVCPDKYDIYQHHIVDNPYPPKTINEDFRRLAADSLPIFFAKDVLLPHVDAGEIDLYYHDDTHWSYKSARYVADSLATVLQLQQNR